MSSGRSINVILSDEAATEALAERLGAALPSRTDGWTWLLNGELGTGKSTFARALIRSFGHEGPIPSPTYTLVEPYRLPQGNVYHIDLYRVSDPGELRYLGWAELEEGFKLVEWPDRAGDAAAQADLSVTLSYRGIGRTATLESLSPRGEALLDGVGIGLSSDPELTDAID